MEWVISDPDELLDQLIPFKWEQIQLDHDADLHTNKPHKKSESRTLAIEIRRNYS
jgi:hypothetical protein